MKLLCATLFLVIFSGCAGEDREGANRALTAMGFTDIKIEPAKHPWSVFTSRCSKDDDIQHGFTAKNVSGAPVSGVVCCAAWTGKGCTVRF